MNCNAYGRKNLSWENIYKNDEEDLVEIGK